MIIAVFLSVATAAGVYLPSPYDKDGWGLRVHNLSVRGPILRGEVVGRIHFDVTLINFSAETREHDPLPVSRDTHDLVLSIAQPDGEWFDWVGLSSAKRDPFTQPIKLRAGESSSLNFNFFEFGYAFCRFGQVGRYRVHPSIKVCGRPVKGPAVELEVVEVPAGGVLASHPVALEGREFERPEPSAYRPVVQQVKLGDRTLLVYRLPWESKGERGVALTSRLAELPGKCEMTVEGAYGDGGPLAITYKTSPMAPPTKIVINSISGTTWTEEEQQLWQERLKNAKP